MIKSRLHVTMTFVMTSNQVDLQSVRKSGSLCIGVQDFTSYSKQCFDYNLDCYLMRSAVTVVDNELL